MHIYIDSVVRGCGPILRFAKRRDLRGRECAPVRCSSLLASAGVWGKARAKILCAMKGMRSSILFLSQDLSFTFSIIKAKLPTGSNSQNSYVFSSKSFEPPFEPAAQMQLTLAQMYENIYVFHQNALSLHLSLGSNAAHAGSNV